MTAPIPKKLTPEQETLVIERRQLWRICTLAHLADELRVSVSTIRRTEREWRKRNGLMVDTSRSAKINTDDTN